MRTLITAAIAALAIVPAAASASYGTQPGFEVAQGQTACSGAGAFGAFGDKGDVAHDFAGGANGYQTGLNNSSLCGNR